jgi:sigma-B regulation protein RsbU (phosphoserine phosphatase)
MSDRIDDAFLAEKLRDRLASVPGIDAYAVLIPKHVVTADFIEVVPREGRLVVAIGEAPGTGPNGAFVAGSIATVFRSLVLAPGPLHLGRTLSELSSLVSGHQHLECVSLQCVEINLRDGVATVASAGHPYPVLYSTRYRRCDRLPVRGPLLHAQQSPGDERRAYELRHVEIGDGDAIVLVSDGVTQGGPLSEPYGYRFSRVVEEKAGAAAEAIGEAILDDWRSHLRGEPPVDDAAILVMTLDSTRMRSPSHAD